MLGSLTLKASTINWLNKRSHWCLLLALHLASISARTRERPACATPNLRCYLLARTLLFQSLPLQLHPGARSFAALTMAKTGNKTAKNGSAGASATASNGHGNVANAMTTNGTVNTNGVANENGKAKSSTSGGSNSNGSIVLSLFLRLLRTTLIDAPLAILFAALVVTICTRHIYDNYLSKNLKNMEWTKQRKVAEITYYDRRCDPSDISTGDVADLLIQSNYTKDDCVHHMMVHGASMYPDLLTADTAIKLRQFVLRRNAELTDKDAITVIENKQRWVSEQCVRLCDPSCLLLVLHACDFPFRLTIISIALLLIHSPYMHIVVVWDRRQ